MEMPAGRMWPGKTILELGQASWCKDRPFLCSYAACALQRGTEHLGTILSIVQSNSLRICDIGEYLPPGDPLGVPRRDKKLPHCGRIGGHLPHHLVDFTPSSIRRLLKISILVENASNCFGLKLAVKLHFI
jgi:hypothetical protein